MELLFYKFERLIDNVLMRTDVLLVLSVINFQIKRVGLDLSHPLKSIHNLTDNETLIKKTNNCLYIRTVK